MGEGAKAQECSSNAGEGREADSPIRPPEAAQPCPHPDFSAVTLNQISALQSCRRMTARCSQPPSLWQLVAAVMENKHSPGPGPSYFPAILLKYLLSTYLVLNLRTGSWEWDHRWGHKYKRGIVPTHQVSGSTRHGGSGPTAGD